VHIAMPMIGRGKAPAALVPSPASAQSEWRRASSSQRVRVCLVVALCSFGSLRCRDKPAAGWRRGARRRQPRKCLSWSDWILPCITTCITAAHSERRTLRGEREGSCVEIYHASWPALAAISEHAPHCKSSLGHRRCTVSIISCICVSFVVRCLRSCCPCGYVYGIEFTVYDIHVHVLQQYEDHGSTRTRPAKEATNYLHSKGSTYL
jgi:hypothetical protein